MIQNINTEGKEFGNLLTNNSPLCSYSMQEIYPSESEKVSYI